MGAIRGVIYVYNQNKLLLLHKRYVPEVERDFNYPKAKLHQMFGAKLREKVRESSELT